MDRRQRKTRTAIFNALIELLGQQDFSRITVEQIIQKADIGRATFYAHFETKDFLLKAFCRELFCHIFQHLRKNDNHILQLLSRQNNGLFLEYFQNELQQLVISQLPLFESRKDPRLPTDFWVAHIAATFVQTLRWWISTGLQDTPETVTEYFFLAVS